jgi:hypothetical protein
MSKNRTGLRRRVRIVRRPNEDLGALVGLLPIWL